MAPTCQQQTMLAKCWDIDDDCAQHVVAAITASQDMHQHTISIPLGYPWLNCNCFRALGAGEDLKTFDVDNKWGRKALERILMDTIGQSDAMPAVKVSSRSLLDLCRRQTV